MVHESLHNLRLDRRLEHRRGWLSPQERERELAALPDVSGKIAPPEEEAAPEGSAGQTAEKGAEAADPEPEPGRSAACGRRAIPAG